MGLFSKKPKVPEYDPADCEAKKKGCGRFLTKL